MNRAVLPLLAIVFVFTMGACRRREPQTQPNKPASKPSTAQPQTGDQQPTEDQAKPSSTSASAVPLTDNDERIVLEAEDYFKIEKPMVVAKMADNKRRGTEPKEVTYIWCPEGPGCKDISNGKGRALLKFALPKDGEYWFWIRKNWHCSCGKTLDFVLRSGNDENGPVAASFTMSNNNYQVWEWLPYITLAQDGKTFCGLHLKSGDYVLEIKNNEDGARIDKVLLTLQRDYVPVH